jgi:hypothetical protein
LRLPQDELLSAEPKELQGEGQVHRRS